MPKEIESYDFAEHPGGRSECPACAEGYPHPCHCGGLIHAAVVAVAGDGYVELTRCDRCGRPEAVGP